MSGKAIRRFLGRETVTARLSILYRIVAGEFNTPF
jgi:hypothetical protein